MYKVIYEPDYNLQLDIPPLHERYSKLVAEGKRKIVYVKNAFDNSTFRYRAYNVYLALQNSTEYSVTFFSVDELKHIVGLTEKIDLLILQRASYHPTLQNFLYLVKLHHVPVVYDMDDSFYTNRHVVKYISASAAEKDFDLMTKLFGSANSYNVIMSQCDAFIATVKQLAEQISKDFNKPCFVLKNFLNEQQITASELAINNRTYDGSEFTVGYFSGSPSHIYDFKLVENALCEFMKKHEDVRVKVVGFMKFGDKLKPFVESKRINFINLVSFQTLQYEIASVDVNIAPLVENEFNECKSELKFFEAGAVKVPSVVSNTKVYRNIITDGTDGFIANGGDWLSLLEKLYADRNLCKKIGESAYLTVKQRYFPEAVEGEISDLFNKLVLLNK